MLNIQRQILLKIYVKIMQTNKLYYYIEIYMLIL